MNKTSKNKSFLNNLLSVAENCIVLRWEKISCISQASTTYLKIPILSSSISMSGNYLSRISQRFIFP